MTRITGTLHADQYTFMITSRSVLLIMRNVSDRSRRENQNTHLIFNYYFQKPCHLWDDVKKYCRAGQAGQNTIWRMSTACWTQTHTQNIYIYIVKKVKYSHYRP